MAGFTPKAELTITGEENSNLSEIVENPCPHAHVLGGEISGPPRRVRGDEGAGRHASFHAALLLLGSNDWAS